MFLHEADIVGQILEYLTHLTHTMLIWGGGWRGIRRDSEERVLTNPFTAPCVFLGQEPIAFTQLSVSGPWSLIERFYVKVMHNLLTQLH